MAPRARLLRSRDAARLAARPRPNVLPRFVRPRDNPPAFCAACSACARNGFVLGERVERMRPGRMRKSSFPVILGSQGVESCGPITSCRKGQGALDLRNVRSMVEIAALFQPADRAHLARFILPSSVARPLRPIPELQASKSAKRIATRYACDHCYRSSYDWRTSRSADSRFGGEKRPINSQLNCDLTARRMQTDRRSPRVHALDKQRSFPPRNCTPNGKRSIFTLPVAEQCRDRRDVLYCIRWKRFACCEVLLKTRWTCVVGSKEACRSEAVAHLLEVGGARQDVVASIKRIETEIIANTELDPGTRHELHQAHSTPSRHRVLISPTLNLHHSTDPACRDGEAAGRLVDEFGEPIGGIRTRRSLRDRARFEDRQGGDQAQERRDRRDDACDGLERMEPCNRVGRLTDITLQLQV